MNSSQFDREHDQLERDLAEGLITQKEFNAGLREMREEQREYAREQADRAYDDAMDLW